ncbi:dienelactone hydrolase family protein [Georgenia halophila]|uniref:Dienelactone hydrolase family protein n=1 Tax=Georgenia halophila TaxID=620889 RepID=A0ABP8LF05_9MICO
MEDRPSAIGGYEDWPGWVRSRPVLDGDATTREVGGLLGVPQPGTEPDREAGTTPEPTPEPPTVRTWQRDGVAVTETRWSTGFGPATRAWILRPSDTVGPLPGVLALHCHGGVKSIGAEKLLRTPEASATAERVRRDLYGGRPFAEDLARAGFVVLAHDTFAWGSRRFALDPLPTSVRAAVHGAEAARVADRTTPDTDRRYDVAAGAHEHVVAKAAGYLGTSFAGMVAHDDLVALRLLRSLPGVDPARTAVAGMSGGGGRSATLASLDPDLRTAVVVAMMTTTQALFPAHVDAHSWLLATPLGPEWGLPRLAAGWRRHDLLAISLADDELFPPDGVRAAHRELAERYAGSGSGRFEDAILPGPHGFPPEAQDMAIDFLVGSLGG